MMLRPFLICLVPVLLATRSPGEITFAESGEVTIPIADCEVRDGVVTAKFKFRRWGMYSFSVKGGGEPLAATFNGKEKKRAHEGTLGDFYIAKEEEGPLAIEVRGATKGIAELRLTPACEGVPVVQAAGQPIELDARDSTIHGVRLVYEPQPKKLCVGYWINPKDYPQWDFTVTTPGTYEVLFTQGCGKDRGGSVAVVECAGSELEFTVQDTGGFQNWVERNLGTVTFKEAGPQNLKVRIRKKAKGIMDIRRIVLKPVK